MKIQINPYAVLPPQFHPLFSNAYTYFSYDSGRGWGKSYSVALALVFLSLKEKHKILCLREVQNSIAESSKASLESMIINYGLSDFFRVTNTEITCCVTESKFIFKGAQNHTVASLKSLADITITWVEEAQNLSRKSYQLILPTVVRTKNPKVIFTWNPMNDWDIVWESFVANTPPPGSLVYRLPLYKDNDPSKGYSSPFFKGSELEKQMLHDKEHLPYNEYAWIWEGKLLEMSDDSIFKGCNLSLQTMPYNRADYAKITIGVDPATTSKAHSNESGIVVVGQLHNGSLHILDDYSGALTPTELALRVRDAAINYNTKSVVIETNQGGDFLKSTLLLSDPTLDIAEVRATSDKPTRAKPVANLMLLNKLCFVDTGCDFSTLQRQMKQITTRGYQGAKGESPDRLDACVWAVVTLSNISLTQQLPGLFNVAWFENTLDSNYYPVIQNLTAITFDGNDLVGVRYDIYRYNSDFRIVFTDSFVNVDEPLEATLTRVVDIPLNENLLRQYPNAIASVDINEVLPLVIQCCKNGKAIMAETFKVREYNSRKDKLLPLEISMANRDNLKTLKLTKLFVNVLAVEFSLF